MYPLAVATLGLATLVQGVPHEIDRRLNNGVGVTPAMGWNNYNAGLLRFYTQISIVKETNSMQVQRPQVL
jgi:hypothetical protein